MSNLYRGSSKDASYQVSIHLDKWFQRRRFFRNQPIRNQNCLWRPCLLTDRDEMSNLYRGPAIDAPYQVSVHLATRFQRRRFLKFDQSETRIAYGSPFSIQSCCSCYATQHLCQRSFYKIFVKFRLIDA